MVETGRSDSVRSSLARASLRTRITSPTVCPVALKIRFTVRADTPWATAIALSVTAPSSRWRSM